MIIFTCCKSGSEDAVQLKIGIAEDLYDQFLIPPISLQVLAENAIKHNEFSVSHPLMVEVQLQHGWLIVKNPIRKKVLRKPSSRIGLANLQERYKLTTNRDIIITEEEEYFVVRLPVLKIT